MRWETVTLLAAVAMQMAVVALLAGAASEGVLAVDFRSYETAAEAVATGASPWGSVAEAQATWDLIHRTSGLGEPLPEDVDLVAGPYLYPPSLALALQQSGLSPTVWPVLLGVATLGVTLAWRRLAGLRGWLWPLLLLLSWDFYFGLLSGNVEVVLIALGLWACWLMWRGWGAVAAIPIAIVVLVKPFYLLLFVGFGLVMLRGAPDRRMVATDIAAAMAATVFLVGIEIWRWPEWLRADTWSWLGTAAQYTYLAAPPDRQWPLDAWNRAPLQLFRSAGLDLASAQAAAVALWAGAVAVVLAALPRRSPGFALTFALSWCLLLAGRPQTMMLPVLGLVVLGAVWDVLGPGRIRTAAVAVTALVLLSHWLALGLTLAGVAPLMVTLQTPGAPVETVLLFPAALVLCVVAAKRAVRAVPPGVDLAGECPSGVRPIPPVRDG